jgi:hypothetical protein
VPGATPAGGQRGGGLPAEGDVKLVLVDEQHHERAGGVAVEGAGDGEGRRLVGGAVDKPSSASDAGAYDRSGTASQSSSATTWKIMNVGLPGCHVVRA